MKLRELIELTRGLDDRAFLERFACPFLMEEGHLPHEAKLKLGRPPTNEVPPGELDQELDEMAERRVFPIRRKDGNSGEVTIGRGAATDIQLDIQSASTRHAVLKPPGDGRAHWVVVDTVSTNGTFVDGTKIGTGREVDLVDATVVRFGPDLRLAFYEPHQFLRVLRQISKAISAAKPGTPDGGKTIAPKFRPTEVHKGEAVAKALGEPSLLDTEVTRAANLPPTPTAKAPPRPAPAVAAKGPPPPAPAKKPGAAPAPGPGEKTEIGLKVPADLRVPGAPRPASAPSPRPAGSVSAAGSGTLRAVPKEGAEAVPAVVLACDPFVPLPLEPFRPIVIGRVPGNEMVLPNPQVSRRHCEVERVRDGVVVRDLGSANGVYIGDRKVDRGTVPFGGNFTIGPYKLEVRPLDPSQLPSGPSPGETMVARPKAQDEGLRGTFEDMPLTEILSGVEFNQKTGIIDIQGDAGIAGFVSFRGGAPHQARCGKTEGEPALYQLLALSTGRFVLKSDEASVGPRAIDASFTKILLEHGRRRDEGSKAKKS
jgi:pSer/pThr/pTyr-binding forkhead associated (FHA) protein